MKGSRYIAKSTIALLIVSILACHPEARCGQMSPRRDTVNLAGTWNFKPDPRNVGVEQEWFGQLLPGEISLPGSMAENGFGEGISSSTRWTGQIVDPSWFTEARFEKYRRPDNVKVPFWLTPVKHYVGPAWYQKQVVIPQEWTGKQIALVLERCHWETQLWADGKLIGKQNSLSIPHRYDLTAELTPGRHTLTIRVDNTVKIAVGKNAHSVSDHTQTNWNGIIGRIELRVTDPLYIDDIQIYPDVPSKSASLRVNIKNMTNRPVKGTLTIRARTCCRKAHIVPVKQVPFSARNQDNIIELQYNMGSDALLWDEFSPNVYELTATISGANFSSTSTAEFGLREFGTADTQFTINGRKTLLRGTLECCIFPLTGYPPADIESWLRILKVAKAHGLNHLRFHSWCPPQAAFQAADRLGFYFQVEGPFWTTIGNGGPVDEFVHAECDRILKEYGNHPSFCLMAYGNEPGGSNQRRFLGDLVNHWKQQDPRHLYTSASGWPIIAESDYHSSPAPRGHQWGAGLSSRMNASPPETITDYRDFVAQYKVPVVSHEIGQWCVYPNFEEIAKYTGVTRAYNLEIFRDGLQENHMLDQAHDFLMASGKLQVLCYKEEIESALRTPGFGGFQLLDLHDFPGQGTALVGVLDAFWDSKGYVTRQEYHRFACETVPLARMAKRVWTNTETFSAAVEVSHFGAAAIANAVPRWSVTDEKGSTIACGVFPPRKIPLGNCIKLGKISLPLAAVPSPQKLRLSVFIQGTDYSNDWNFWVYPCTVDLIASSNILVTGSLDEKAIRVLQSGGKLLFLPPLANVKGQIVVGFTPIFWNTAWTRQQAPHTLGLLCDSRNPAFDQFPTDYHSNWQWWELVTRSKPMILTDFPARFRPLVQVIDDWFTNRRLGLLFEAKVNEGKLLVCSIDLQDDLDRRPVARQMRHSLLKYMDSAAFNPKYNLDIEIVKNLLQKPPVLTSLGAKVIHVDSQANGHEGDRAIDGNPDAIWHTQWEPVAPDYPHEIRVDTGRLVELKGFEYLPRQDMPNGWVAAYEFYISSDGKTWGRPVASGTFARNKDRETVRFDKPRKARFIRFVAVKGIDGQRYASVAELDIITEQ